MAAKRTGWPKVWHYGATFEPWYIQKSPTGLRLFGSYGMNAGAYDTGPENAIRMPLGEGDAKRPKKWSAADVPVMLDSLNWPSIVDIHAKPPEFEGALSGPEGIGCFCINRHNGTVNGSFLDWSVRKVGVKELWTLKWAPTTDTRGPWTKAGGVQPEDWPAWMRGFKDY